MSTLPRSARALPAELRLAPLPAVFISHSSMDNPFGTELATNLRHMGYDVWYDSSPGRDADGLIAGDLFFERIQRELTARPVFVVILSTAAMASAWVRDEVSMAWSQKNRPPGKVIIPVLFQSTSVLPALDVIEYVSFLDNRPYENAFAELLTAIRLGKTRERETAYQPLLPVGPPFEEAMLELPPHFIGRAEDLGWLLERLRSGGTTGISAVNGMGGIGKTALAGEAVRRLRKKGRFADGVAVVLAVGKRDAQEVLREALRRFDRQNAEIDTLDLGALATLAHKLLDEKDALIVLDNVEPDLAAAEVVTPLRETGVTVLVTARATLPARAVAAGESRILQVLDEGDARELFAFYFGHGPFGALPEKTQQAITTIVEELERHTLAVKLAAAYAAEPGHALPTLIHDLRDPRAAIALLPESDAPAAVQASFSKSYETLPPPAQALFAGLSLFPTTEFGRQAAWALAEGLGLAEPRSLVDLLVRRALVDAYNLGTMPPVSDHERLRLHALMQGYAASLLADPRSGWIQSRREKAERSLAEWYMWYMSYTGYAHKRENLALGPDEANILGSLHWARSRGDDELEVEIALGVQYFWRDISRTRTALEELPPAIAAAERMATESGSPEDRLQAVRLALTYANILQNTGRLYLAKQEYARNVAILQELGDRSSESQVLSDLGRIAWQWGQLAEAESYFQQALAILQDLGDWEGEAMDLSNLGHIALQRGQMAEAENYFQQSLAIDREVHDRRGEGVDLMNLGHIAFRRGQMAETARYSQQSLAILREVQDRKSEGVVLLNLGRVALQWGQLDQAEGQFQESLAILREVQDRSSEGVDLEMLGQIALQRGQLAEAEGYYQESWVIYLEVGDRRGEGTVLSGLGQIAQQRGQLDQAEGYYQESLAIRREVQDRPGEGAVLANLSQIAYLRGQLDVAEAYYQQSLVILREVQDQRGEVAVLSWLGLISEAQERWGDAAKWYRQGLEVARQLQDASNIASIAQNLGQLLIEHWENREQGCQLLGEAVRIYQQMGLEERAEQTRNLTRELGCDV